MKTKNYKMEKGKSPTTWLRILLVFAAILITGVANKINAQPWTYNFGTGTGTFTSTTASTVFLPAPTSGTARVRCGATSPSIDLVNPGLAFGTGSELSIRSGTGSTSTTKFSIHDYTASKVGYVKYSIVLNGGTNGVYNFTIGDGATFSDNNAMNTAQIFAGVQWTLGASNAITYRVLNNATWGTTGISNSTTLFSQSTTNVYNIEVYYNNNTASADYTRSGTTYTLASDTWDLWVNGVREGTNLASGAISNNVNIDSYAFNHQTSVTSPGTIYLDDIEYSNALPYTCSAPTTQSNTLTFSSVAATSMTVNWTSGNGSKRIVIMNTANSFTNPTDGTDPAANPAYSGSGEQVVYNGSSNTVNITGLSASTTYWFRVYEYNCTGGSTMYMTSTATDNPLSQATTSACASNPTVTTTVAASSIASTTASSGGQTLSAGAGCSITNKGVCWNTSTGPTIANSITDDGTGTADFTSSLTGLSAATLYYARAYVTNSFGTTYGNEITFRTLSTEPSAHPAAFTAAAASTTSIDLTFSAASTITNAYGYIILQRQGANPTGTPTDATGYNVGDAIGDGTVAAIITNTATTTATISSLTSGTQYNYSIIAYNYDGTNAATYNYRTAATIKTANATTHKTEPTAQVTSFAVGTVTTSAIPLTYTTASPAPDYYEIKLSADPTAVIDPVDGTDPADVTAVTAGLANKAVTGGTSSATSFTSMTAGTMYNYKIYSFNNTGTAINFLTTGAPSLYHATLPAAVTSPSINITGTTTADLGWTLPGSYNSGNHSVLVFVKATSAVTAGTPTNAPSTYTASTDFSTPGTAYQNDAAAYCVYKGDGTSVSITGLTSGTTYHIRVVTVVDASNSNSTNSYSSGATDNATTYKSEPTAQVTSFAVGTVTTSAIPLTYTSASPAPDYYEIKLSADPTAVVDPIDGTDPADVTAVTAGLANKAVTGGTSSATSFTSMTAGTMYNYKIYSFNNTGTAINFLTTGAPSLYHATLPAAVTSPTITITGTSTADLGWTLPGSYSSGNHSVLVFVKAASSVTVGTPTNAPSTYTASTNFSAPGTAYQNDAAAYCVYKGDGTAVSVTGLNPNTTYHIRIVTVVDASNSNTTNSYSAGATANATTLKAEPSNQVTDFMCGSTTASTIALNWTDAIAGSQAPDGYLLLWGTGAITPPIDGTAQADDIPSGIKNITFGTTTYTATGLTDNTIYNFQIWSYTNSGTNINYKLVDAPTTSCQTTLPLVSLWFQGFEGTAADNWSITTNTGGSISASTGGSDTPPTQRIRTGSNSWQSSNTTGTLVLQASSVAGYQNLQAVVYVSSTSVTAGNGADAGDYFRTFISLDGAAFASNTATTCDIDVHGASNSRWGYNTTGTTTTAGTNVTVAGTTGTNTGTIYSKLVINIPDGTSTVSLKIICVNDDGNERWNVDDVEILGLAITPTIYTTSVSGFGNVCTSTTSPEKTYNVSGSNLTNDIVLTPPVGYEISTTSGSGFVANPSTITLTHTAGTVASTPIYVRFKPTLVQAYSGNITHTSTGATTKNVALTGNGVNNAPPTITSPTSASVTATTAVLGGNITATGCTNVSERGIFWSTTNGFADGAGTKVSETAGAPYSTGIFTINVSSLSASTVYYYKAFATNTDGTVYTSQGTFTTPCATVSIPYSQGFNGATIPTCWSQVTVADPGTDPTITYVSSSTNPTITPSEGTHYVHFNSYSSPNGAEMRLISPPIVTTGLTGINLDFDWYESTQYSTYTTEGVKVQYSLDGGSNWTDVQFYQRYNSVAGWKSKNCILPAAVNNQTSVMIGFLFHSQFGNNCDLDNVELFTCSAPTVNSTVMTFANIASNSMDLNIGTPGNGTKRIIVAREGAAVSFTPSNNTTYDANFIFSDATDLGSGNKVVYNGSGSSVTITGLNGSTTYHFKVFEYNCSTGSETYYTGGTILTEDETTLLSPVTNLKVNCQTNTTAEITWTAPAGSYDGVIIGIRNSTNACHSISGDADNYVANAVFPGVVPVPPATSAYGTIGATPYSWVAYKGTGTSVTISGLTAGQAYQIKAYVYKGNTSSVWATTQPTTSIASLGTANVINQSLLVDNTKINLQWTNPGASCFDEVMVVANAGPAITTIPTGDGSAYTANLAFGSGTPYGTGFVVYKGSLTSQTVTALTNGTEYCFTFFTRNGSTWSSGVTACGTPSGVTTLYSGDLAIVAVNTQCQSSGSKDEICFFAFKDITEGTAIDFTDNGYERNYITKWGSSEGTFRLTRKSGSGTVAKGTVICFQGAGSSSADYNIFKCGVADDANWTITSINNEGSTAGSYDLNSLDQIWILQGGTWTNSGDLSDQDATYSGNILYGWTASGWESSVGFDDTKGSRLFQGSECFSTNVQVLSGNSKVKYTGDTSTTSQFNWMLRLNDNSNWTGYTTNTAYNAATVGPVVYNYVGQCFNFLSNQDIGTVNGVWTGANGTDWFECGNWENLRLPSGTTNVTIDASAANNIVIDDGIPSMPSAECNNLTLDNATVSLSVNHASSKFNIYGNFTNTSTLNFSNGEIHFKGNFNNTGGTYTHSGGTAFFDGSSAQTVTAANSFYNLTVGNTSSGLTLANDVTVNNNLTLTEGAIRTGTNILQLGTNTTNRGGTITRTSGFVFGKMKRWFTNATNTGATGLFPMGLPLSINSVANAYYPSQIEYTGAPTSGGSLIAQFTTTMPSGVLNGFPLTDGTQDLDHVADEGVWQIDEADGLTGGTYTITLSGYNVSTVNNASQVRIVKRPSGGGDWALVGTHGTTSGTGSASSPLVVSRTGVTGFSLFGFAGKKADNPLPIELIDFSSYFNGKTVDLNWSTATESNNNYFTIEHSKDGKEFDILNKVNGAGFSNYINKYYTEDIKPFKGLNYYRLSQTDFNGKTSGAYISKVFVDSENKLQIINVIQTETLLKTTICAVIEGSAIIEIIDTKGNIISKHSITTTGNIEIISLQENNLQAGVYILKLSNAKGVAIKKFIIF